MEEFCLIQTTRVFYEKYILPNKDDNTFVKSAFVKDNSLKKDPKYIELIEKCKEAREELNDYEFEHRYKLLKK